MYLSLKGSLGHTPITDRVGEGPLQIAEGAAAAYSLRNLGSNSPSVVRVRRESDNNERDFTAQDISTSVLTNWVNEQIVPPLDIGVLTPEGRIPVPEGGTSIGTPAAAYSLRNLSTTYTGNVVDVRRSTGGTESFTAAEVADGTLTDFVNVGKDYVGYAAFQNSSTSNVNFSSSFILEASESWSIKFGYIGGIAITGLFGGNAANTGFWFANLNSVGLTDDSDSYQPLSFGSALSLKLGQHYEIEFFNTPSEGVRVKVDGTTMTTSPVIYGDITLNKIGVSRGRSGDRVIENVRIDLNGDGTLDYSYAGDGNQASNWTDRVGSNNGTPTAQVLTYNNEYTNGFVSQWYDQSGNDNHATQGTLASQPKIVDGGSLVSDGLSIGSGQYLDMSSNFSFALNNLTSIVLGTANAGQGVGSLVGLVGNLSLFSNPYRFSTTQGFRYGGESSTSQPRSAAVQLFTLIGGSTTADGYANGTLYRTVSSVSTTYTNKFVIGSYTNNLITGKVAEIIIYNADQSNNRTAIEANIGEVYGIAGIPAYDNTVNGFVETWYDQSGNGNDATQSVAGSQPKIVDGGSLVTGGLDFDGTNDHLERATVLTNIQRASIYTVQTRELTSSGYITQASVAPNRVHVQGANVGIGDPQSSTGFTMANDAVSMLSIDAVSGSWAIFLNGASQGTSTTDETSAGGTMGIGATSSGANPFNGKIAEFIIYDSSQSASRVAIETNINDHYNIY
jgi:hypothetical protein